MTKFPYRIAFISVLLVTLLSGCDTGLKTYQAGGKVLMEDETPLAGGRVVFRSVEHGIAAKAVISEDGSFVLGTHKKGDGAVAGLHQVGVTPPMDNPDAGFTVKILPKYRRGSTSGLEFTVSEEEDNHFEITVEYDRRGRATGPKQLPE